MQQNSIPLTAGQFASDTHFQWALNGPGHAVQFFDSDESLTQVVVSFLAEGLRAKQPVVSIASTFHCAAFKEALEEHGFDVEALQASGVLFFINAGALLETILVNRAPDPERFRSIVGDVLERAGSRNHLVRMYGEAVDLLWKAGDPPAALRLEQLWNALASDFHFALVCGYTLDNFMTPQSARAFEDVCAQHHRVIPTDRFGGTGGCPPA
jgi:hypothetical protein